MHEHCAIIVCKHVTASLWTTECASLLCHSYCRIGLNDQSTEGSYRWISDSTALVPANWPNGGPWLTGEPNDSKAANVLGEDCVQMSGGKWRDFDCNSMYPFICT
jgi:hypothetical protein